MSFANPLPGVPAVESPFLPQLLDAAGADAETRRIARDLAEQGFAVLDFPDPDFDRLAESVIAALGPGFPLANFQAGRTGGLRAEQAWQHCPAVREIACNARLLALLGTLYGRPAFPFQTLNFPVGSQQAVHTDSVHFSSLPERFMCGVWVALEDIHPDAGPLVYYPGSHRLPLYVNEHVGNCAAAAPGAANQTIYEALWAALIEAHGLRPALFTPRRGQALIWAANLLHGGLPQADRGRTRWSQVTHYFFEDCAYVTPMDSDPALGHVAFRQVRDLRTGEVVPHRYLGREIPEAFIAAVRPPAKALPAGFDPQKYLAANPDVAAAGVDAAGHWLSYGWKEGRRLAP
ncbi:phytanoyl-CoA dioxygenase family protein [Siccirubricoccus phaeus]|uniref:phytanoyl-CoA dioxygenase family protein n=1 Tax=Siccirubricoccus phaeus TaxID=2595053 RepID=UPI0011F1970F|nr:phytanoyl-CoA dioxygenase family protein [Siccirubricoccus phaeus]